MTPFSQSLLAELTRALDASGLPAHPTRSVASLRDQIAVDFNFNLPRTLEDLVRSASDLLYEGTVHTPHPRYFGLFNPAVTPASVAADALVAAYNPQLAAYSHAPAANEIEQVTLRQIAHRMGLAEGISGHFTSGGSEANQTAVVLALTAAFPSYGDEGSPPRQTRMYVSELAHDSFTKIAHSSGIGRRAVRKIPVDDRLCMDLRSLQAALTEDREAGFDPFLVVGTAGTTAAGAIDPLGGLADLAREQHLWFHVDAAWGGGALLSSRRSELMAGIERADSVTFDAHKWLSVPMGAGMIFTPHGSVIAEAFRVSAGYMPAGTEHGTDPFVHSLQWSRRFIGLKVAMSLAHLGWDGYEEIIERQFALADELRIELKASGWTVINETELPLVLFSHPRIEAGEVFLDAVLQRVYDQGDAWISIAPVRNGRRALRACVTSIHSRSPDIRRLVEICENALS